MTFRSGWLHCTPVSSTATAAVYTGVTVIRALLVMSVVTDWGQVQQCGAQAAVGREQEESVCCMTSHACASNHTGRAKHQQLSALATHTLLAMKGTTLQHRCAWNCRTQCACRTNCTLEPTIRGLFKFVTGRMGTGWHAHPDAPLSTADLLPSCSVDRHCSS
jgi:hypothetical protein